MVYIGLAAVLFTLEVFVKRYINRHFTDPENGRDLAGGAVRIQNLQNPGAAMGLLSKKKGILKTLTVAAMAVIIYFLLKCSLFSRETKSRTLTGLALAAAGAAGNGIERLTRDSVTDYIRLQKLPGKAGSIVFNLSDVMILLAIILL